MSTKGTDGGRDERVHLKGRADDDMLRYAPKHVTKQEFGRLLYQAMLAKGWTQSELARQADISRDKVSTYIRGKTMPTVRNAQKLADVLGVTREALLPNSMEMAVEQDDPDLEIKRSPGMPSHLTWLRVNRAVSLDTALKIAELIQNDNPVDPGRSGGAPALLSRQG